ncbi:CGGC domain-containing protein [Desulfonatronovibrio hydrogenovorans]|uniref:CGGC domain-containing protein n=1 Tax=Desulfonatronovibrio hydrogenovorans TaxID=53245 RepID=UPI00048F41A9|nr:CGGC domain-containing protein [Desulfonatronovibrio hydrogenovorans]
MEKILIIGCKRAMNEVCIGCSRCLVAFNRREGKFGDYPKDAQILGLLSCGDCPGSTIVTRLAQVKLWNSPMQEVPTRVHISPCITDHCPHADEITAKIKNKAGIKVISGTHEYIPEKIFAGP